MVHNVNSLVNALHSRFAPEPGDLIFTGTPSGVGNVVPGDKLEASLWKNKEKITSFIVEIHDFDDN